MTESPVLRPQVWEARQANWGPGLGVSDVTEGAAGLPQEYLLALATLTSGRTEQECPWQVRLPGHGLWGVVVAGAQQCETETPAGRDASMVGCSLRGPGQARTELFSHPVSDNSLSLQSCALGREGHPGGERLEPSLGTRLLGGIHPGTVRPPRPPCHPQMVVFLCVRALSPWL